MYLARPMTSLIAPLWLSDPSWLAMDATARGFHTQLLLLAARRKPAGTLPDDDLLWRKWLGLPIKIASVKEAQLPKAWLKACGDQGMPGVLLDAMSHIIEGHSAPGSMEPDVLMDWLWTTRWKPMILAAWERVDETRVGADPRLNTALGGWIHPLAVAMARGNGAEMETLQATAASKPTRKPKKGALPPPSSWDTQLDVHGEAANAGLRHLDLSVEDLRDPKTVLAKWRPDIDSDSRKSMWEMGVDCLVGVKASSAEKGKARGILGKYIKQYGEEAVAKAVGQMAVRSVPPADAISFLQGVLRQADEGSPAQQAARQKRASLNL